MRRAALALLLLAACDHDPTDAGNPDSSAELVEGVCEVNNPSQYGLPDEEPRSCDEVCADFGRACAGVVAITTYEPNHPQGVCASQYGLELGEGFCGDNPPAPEEFGAEAAAWECYCHAS